MMSWVWLKNKAKRYLTTNMIILIVIDASFLTIFGIYYFIAFTFGFIISDIFELARKRALLNSLCDSFARATAIEPSESSTLTGQLWSWNGPGRAIAVSAANYITILEKENAALKSLLLFKRIGDRRRDRSE